MKRVGQKIYNSTAWQKLRQAYLSSRNFICERCGQPATIVHHKAHITAGNVDNPAITLNFDNLEALCSACHNLEHDNFRNFHGDGDSQGRKAIFDSRGDVVEVTGEQDFCAARQAILAKFNPPQGGS